MKHSKENGQWTKGQFLFSWIEVLGCFHMLSPLIKYPIFNNVPLKACQIVWLKHIIVALINGIVCSCISKVAKECIVICPKNNSPYINNHFTIAFVFASLLLKDKDTEINQNIFAWECMSRKEPHTHCKIWWWIVDVMGLFCIYWSWGPC
jgi:hypothetical protein